MTRSFLRRASGQAKRRFKGRSPRLGSLSSRRLAIDALEDRRMLAATFGINFLGSTFGVDSGSIPPDTNGAVGLNHYVELINGRYDVYDKIDGTQVQTSSLNQFWTDAGVTTPTISSSFDPRVIFDHASQRWFAAATDNRRDADSNILIAVSDFSDPTLGWTGFSIDADPADDRWADFPMLGLDAVGIYVGVNMFDIPGVGADESATTSLFSIPKADLLGGAPTIANLSAFRDLSAGTVGFSVHPGIDYGPDDGRGPFFSTSDTSDIIRRTDVTGAGAAGATLGGTANIAVAAFSDPGDADQPGGKQDINTGNSRLSAATFEVGDSIWAAYAVNGAGGRAAIRWHQIDEPTDTVLQTGTISDPNLEFFFPSIAANEFGDVVIGFSGTSTTQFVSGYAAIGETTGGVTTFGTPLVTVVGTSDYLNLDSAMPPRNRWGDYSATSLDPVDSRVFWTIQEFVSATDVWSTQVTQIITGIEPDPWEPNDSLATATVLGSVPAITMKDLTIDDANDEDWFRITARDTGKLIINVLFADSPGDGQGDLDIRLLDAAGNIIVTSATNDSNEQIIVPVVSQQEYYLQVFGSGGNINVYDLEIENFAVEPPIAVVLTPASDTGMFGNDNVTNDTTPHIFVLADLTGYADMDITVLDAAGAMAGNEGVAVEVFASGVSAGFADPRNFTNSTIFEYAFTPGELDEGLNFITSAVRVFDGSTPTNDGRTQFSSPLLLTLDTLGPFNGATLPDMLASSDSGMFDDDDVTNKMSPAFEGFAEARAKVRLYANGLLVGQGVVGSDSSDGIPDNGLGHWEITVEPLVDNKYTITAEIEDMAGNVFDTVDIGGDFPLDPLMIWIDTINPNTAFLDLLTDSGRNDQDNITNVNQPTVSVTADDTVGGGDNPFPNDIKFRIYDRPGLVGNNGEVLVYDSFADLGALTIDGFFDNIVLDESYPGLAAYTLLDGPHNLKLEVEDRAGNLSDDFLLDLVIDTVAPPAPSLTIDPASSDTGVLGQPFLFVDHITSDTDTKFIGVAEADALVRLYADGPAISELVINGSDVFDGQAVAVPLDGNQAEPQGQFEITTLNDLNNPNLFPTDGRRQMGATAEDVAGNVSEAEYLDIFIDTRGPQVDDVSISGYGDYPLFDPKPSEDGPTPLVFGLDVDFIDYPIRGEGGEGAGGVADVIVIIDESGSMDTEQAFIGGFIQDIDMALAAAGIGAGVIDTNQFGLVGYGSSANTLGRSILVDGGLFGTSAEFETASNQLVTDGSEEDGYKGIDFVLSNYTFRPQAEKLVILVTDEDRDNLDAALNFANTLDALDMADVTLISILDVDLRDGGNTSALAIDSMGNAFIEQPGGAFQVASGGQAISGAGNTIADYVDLTLDNEGFVADLNQLRAGGNSASSFSNALVEGIVEIVAGGFVYPAVNEILATTPGNYRLVGDHTGNVLITGIEFFDNTSAGTLGMTSVRLHFAEPLPDDRFTLTISDTISDDVGNALDGESQAASPFDESGTDIFPSGDLVPGGDFVARFTVDTRAEIGTYAYEAVHIDTNGNFVFDPEGEDNDRTNRDLVYQFGFTTDVRFAGNFADGGAADGFDKLAAYGFVDGQWRWLIDTDNDGVPNIDQVNPLAIQGFPVAGDFNSLHPGDEVGIFTGDTWYFDVNGDFLINDVDIAGGIPGQLVPGRISGGNMVGYPIVGDFDGDGLDDLGTWDANQFQFDLAFDGINGFVDAGQVIDFGFPGVVERPVAADMDGDGIDDIGLWSPEQASQTPGEASEWYFLLSDDFGRRDIGGGGLGGGGGGFGGGDLDVAGGIAIDRDRVFGTVNTLDHPFSPAPLGDDLFAQFGDVQAIPIVGNFDPPVAGASSGSGDGSDSGNNNGDGGQTTVFDVAANTAFLEELYSDLLGRGSDAGGLNSWLQAIEGGKSRDDVAQGFWYSPEHMGILVDGYYDTYLDRTADSAGRAYWTNKMVNGMSQSVMAVAFLASDEYVARNGTFRVYVDSLYQRVLNRQSERSGRDYWVGQLERGLSRADAIRAFVNSPEKRTRAIDAYHDSLLDRSVATDELAVYMALIEDSGSTLNDVVETILASEEYFANAYGA